MKVADGMPPYRCLPDPSCWIIQRPTVPRSTNLSRNSQGVRVHSKSKHRTSADPGESNWGTLRVICGLEQLLVGLLAVAAFDERTLPEAVDVAAVAAAVVIAGLPSAG
eukprot:INCI18137.4.p2 GENE.INCI18137.4~~INCI18137.4.p2  ORF type:complete len:108 (-),score=10.71 INCI18137.4:262-585(-)